MAMCQRLAELGMQLAEEAHREALRELHPPEARARQKLPGFPDFPGLPSPIAFRETTCGELFTRLSRCVRQAILLEARLDSGTYDRPRREPATPDTAPTPTHAGSPRTAHHQADTTALACEGQGDDLACEGQGDDLACEGLGDDLACEALEDDLACDTRRAPEEILATIRAELDPVLASRPPTPPRPAVPAAAQPVQHHLAGRHLTGTRMPARPGRPPDKHPPPKPG